MANITPVIKQYLEIKAQYPDTILFFRLGDFYMIIDEATKRNLDIFQTQQGEGMIGSLLALLDQAMTATYRNLC